MAQNKLVFVVGLWRSGTSLLHAMLNLHPQIALMFESEPLVLWPPHTAAIPWPEDWPQRLDFFNQAISRHGLDPARLPKPVAGRAGTLALCEAYAQRKGATIVGGKAPAYHAMLPELRRMFPEASFIILWRNPEACCRSAALAGQTDDFFAQWGIKTRLLFGAAALARGVGRLRAGGAPVHELTYDDLVEHPETQLRAICQFLEIPFDPQMLALAAADLSVLPAGRHHHEVRSGVIHRPAPRAPKPEAAGLLSPAFQAKARRYAVLWRECYEDLGLAHTLPPATGGEPPGRLEQWLDGAGYFFWRKLDFFKFMIIRNLPLSWWRRCRRPAGETGRASRAPESKIVPRSP